MMQVLLSHADNPRPHNGTYGLLHVAAFVGDRADMIRTIAEIYRSNGITLDLDERDNTPICNTPLSIAVSFGNHKCALEVSSVTWSRYRRNLSP